MRETMRDVIKRTTGRSSALNIFGFINLGVVESNLISAGYKRIPNKEKLKAMCMELFADEMVRGEISFMKDEKEKK